MDPSESSSEDDTFEGRSVRSFLEEGITVEFVLKYHLLKGLPSPFVTQLQETRKYNRLLCMQYALI